MSRIRFKGFPRLLSAFSRSPGGRVGSSASIPDWFFWAYENGALSKNATLKQEADLLYKRARNIKIPNNQDGNLVVEYLLHFPSDKFGDFEVVPKSRPLHLGSSPAWRKDQIDLSITRNIANYDKTGYRLFLHTLKYYTFGDAKIRMTKSRCEDFFSNPANFH